MALVAVQDRLLGLLGGLVLLLTRVEFPALYWHLVELAAPVVLLVAARNRLLAVFFVAKLWRLWRLREPVHESETTVHAFVHKGGAG